MEIKDLLFVYSEELRLRILFLLKGSEICVNCLEAVLQSPQPTISRHIGILRRAHIAVARRKAQNVYYSLNKSLDEKVHNKLMSVFLQEYKDKEPFSSDRIRLLNQKNICTVECKISEKG